LGGGAADMINSMQAHVLIDLNGYTDGGRPEIGVLRPAPVVVRLPLVFAPQNESVRCRSV
jgi:predicted O-linked N-acetylglucosamine transferase (SPINDLY family)